MTLEDFEACEGKPQNKSCCTKPAAQPYTNHVGSQSSAAYGYGYGWDYDGDDDYYRHIGNDSVRDHFGLPLVKESGTSKEK